MDRMRELEAPPSPLGYSAVQPDEVHRGRSGQGTTASKVRPCGPLAALRLAMLTPANAGPFLPRASVSMVSRSPRQPARWPWF